MPQTCEINYYCHLHFINEETEAVGCPSSPGSTTMTQTWTISGQFRSLGRYIILHACGGGMMSVMSLMEGAQCLIEYKPLVSMIMYVSPRVPDIHCSGLIWGCLISLWDASGVAAPESVKAHSSHSGFPHGVAGLCGNIKTQTLSARPDVSRGRVQKQASMRPTVTPSKEPISPPFQGCSPWPSNTQPLPWGPQEIPTHTTFYSKVYLPRKHNYGTPSNPQNTQRKTHSGNYPQYILALEKISPRSRAHFPRTM